MNLKLLQQSFVLALNALGSRVGTEFKTRFAGLRANGGANLIGTSNGQTVEARLQALAGGNGGGEGGGGYVPLPVHTISTQGTINAKDLPPNAYLRLTGSGGVEVSFHDEDDGVSGAAFADDVEWHIRNTSDSSIGLTINSNGTWHTDAGSTNAQLLIEPNKSVVVKRVAKNTFDVIGQVS